MKIGNRKGEIHRSLGECPEGFRSHVWGMQMRSCLQWHRGRIGFMDSGKGAPDREQKWDQHGDGARIEHLSCSSLDGFSSEEDL